MTMLPIRHEDVRAMKNSGFRFMPRSAKGRCPKEWMHERWRILEADKSPGRRIWTH